jgi:hypothetical protein
MVANSVTPPAAGKRATPRRPHWARVKSVGGLGLRRGAWYRVLSFAPLDVTVDINHKPVVVPRTEIELAATAPQRWTVVPRPSNAPRLPASWGDQYAVCPNCRSRAQLHASSPTLRCARCNGQFPVGWEEKYLGRN